MRDAGCLYSRLFCVGCNLEDARRAFAPSLYTHAQRSPRQFLLAICNVVYGRCHTVVNTRRGLPSDGRGLQPRYTGASYDKPLSRVVYRRKVVAARDKKVEKPENVIALVMWWFTDLTVRQDGIKNSKVCVSQGVSRGRIVRKVDKVPKNYIDQDMQIVCVEVFGRRRVTEQKVQDLENEKLKGCLRLSVQEENEIAPKGFIRHSMTRQCFNQAVRYRWSAVFVMTGRCYQVLLVHDQLPKSQV